MAVRRALTRLMTDRTTLVIAHRLSTIRNADIIVAMENGRIVEQGTHDELASSDGLYSRLVRHQMATARPPDIPVNLRRMPLTKELSQTWSNSLRKCAG